jgi:hypothetical protein
MTARGKCEAKRSTSPLVNKLKSAVALKGRNNIPAFQALSPRFYRNQGRRASLRFALALAFIFRAFGALFRFLKQGLKARDSVYENYQ